MSLKILTIGDPHFKHDNASETDMMVSQIRDLIIELNPDITVVLGDVDHTHEKMNLYSHRRSVEGLRIWHSVSKKLVLLIGNHDRPNNNVYLTDEHSFNALKEWSNTLVVDKVYRVNEGDFKLVYAPYVPTGRLGEALTTVDLKAPYEGVDAVFAHQEFKGAKMNAITSNEGDLWGATYPLCISGHIHDYDRLQPNLIYVGTPIQHGYSDTKDKTVSVFTFTKTEGKTSFVETRHVLHIPKKIQISLTAEELSVYVLPPLTHVKIKVHGTPEVIREVLKMEHVMKLLSTSGVKIVPVDISPKKITAGLLPIPKIKMSFQKRILDTLVNEPPHVQSAFKHLFPS